MKKFIITFTDTIEAETKEQALEVMLNCMDYEKDNQIELFDFEQVDGGVAQRQRQAT
tara:strand:- start:1222 stop:1392 length:171 start_codon:yes stop_codon:yes gene_type:complete